MKSDQAEKCILEVDGEELEGLVNINDYEIQTDVIDVPGYDRSVPVSNGVRKIPPITAIYKITRDSQTLGFLENWFYKKEQHEVTLRRTDGAGREFHRELWQSVELAACSPGGYDAAAPSYAKVKVIFLPEEIRPLKAE